MEEGVRWEGYVFMVRCVLLVVTKVKGVKDSPHALVGFVCFSQRCRCFRQS